MIYKAILIIIHFVLQDTFKNFGVCNIGTRII